MKKKRILNVGCGTEFIPGTDFIDLFPTRKDVIKLDVDVEKLPYANETFDEVYSNNLLEHLTNIGFAMKEMVRVLKKRGKLTVITDNANFFDWARSGTHLGRSYEKIRPDTPEDRHYSLFTTWHLENFYRKLNIRIDRVEYYKDFELRSPLKLIAFLLSFTPYWRMSKTKIIIEGTKR